MGQIEKERLLKQLEANYREEAMEVVHEVKIWDGAVADGIEEEGDKIEGCQISWYTSR